MIVAKCISKNRNSSGIIKDYTLQDQNGIVMNITGQNLKRAITSGSLAVTNLQIDRAGRLIDKSETENNTACKTQVSKQLIENVGRVYNSEMQGSGTGAFQFCSRVIKEYIEQNKVDLKDVIKALPEELQYKLYRAFVIYSAESSLAVHNIKDDIKNIAAKEGEKVGKLAAYLVKKYSVSDEFKVSTKCHEEEYFKGGPIVSVVDSVVYVRKPKIVTEKQRVKWSNFLGNIKSTHYGIGIYLVNNKQSVQKVEDINEKNGVYSFDYHENLKDDTVAILLGDGHRKLNREDMISLITKLSKDLDKYGIIAEVYSKSGEGFVKLFS